MNAKRKTKALTTLEAAEIGREMGVRGLIVCRDGVDRRLWRVATADRCQTHEPMDEAAWREFIAGWIDRPARYDAGDGRKVTVPPRHESVAYSGDAADVLRDVLRDTLSPQAVAAIAAYIQPVRTMDPEVVRELRWFQELLTAVVGGKDELNRLCEEVGL